MRTTTIFRARLRSRVLRTMSRTNRPLSARTRAILFSTMRRSRSPRFSNRSGRRRRLSVSLWARGTKRKPIFQITTIWSRVSVSLIKPPRQWRYAAVQVVFHQRRDQVTVDQLLRLDGVHQQQIVIRFLHTRTHSLNGAAAIAPVSVRVRSPALVTPYNIISDLSVEKSLPKGFGL